MREMRGKGIKQNVYYQVSYIGCILWNSLCSKGGGPFAYLETL